MKFSFQTGSIRLWDKPLRREQLIYDFLSFHSKLVRLDFETSNNDFSKNRKRYEFSFQTGSIRLWDFMGVAVDTETTKEFSFQTGSIRLWD